MQLKGIFVAVIIVLALAAAPTVSAGTWWEDWARFSFAIDPGSVGAMDANVAGPTSGGVDEGRDPYDRE